MMKTFFVSAVLILAACAVAVPYPVDMCPNRCNLDRSLSETECNHPVTRGVCSVSSCTTPQNQNGFACEMPEDSFIIANVHLSAIDLVLEYSWSGSQSDLDTSTRFLRGNAGWSCNPDTEYLDFSGDDTSYGGRETTVIDISGALADGKWSGSTSVAAFAGWHGTEDEGDFTLKASLRRKSDGGIVPGTLLSSTVSPGAQHGCAATEVGTVEIVSAQHHTRFTLQA
eukprot:gb/GEZJ01004812.1/.p1 GENE.gb/GEZJ01004812.1/~~gb/GEZJ01004812.1/.p1  ORF type:complete len:226 (-),score=26.23 gb/GEZJ01004812.1/:225-902(-)